MTTATLEDLDILDIGNTIQIGGAIWTGNGKVYLVPLPDEDMGGGQVLLRMDSAQFERFLNQTDVLDVRGPDKAILRKSQRQIDQVIAWEVFDRDGYRCRYCDRKAPLTVDHVILWEQGGATVRGNLISACRRCNKLRGSMEYADWLKSKEYRMVSAGLTMAAHLINSLVVDELDRLRSIKQKGRTR
jgi:hypothetical protein